MKTSITFLLFLLLPICYVKAQQADAYPKAMQSALAQMQNAATADEYTAAVNTFSRISEAMPGEWLPAYYKNLIRLNNFDKLPSAAEKDKMLEEVLMELERLLEQHPNNSELLTLKGYHHMLFVAADPASRGAQFSGSTIQILQQAIAADPNNPRAYLLLGQMQWGMAQFMNSSTADACKLFSKANELYTAATVSNNLAPGWGAKTAQQLQQRCQANK